MLKIWGRVNSVNVKKALWAAEELGLKYQRIDTALRERQRAAWNAPVLWPLALIGLLIALLVVPAVTAYRRRERGVARGRHQGS